MTPNQIAVKKIPMIDADQISGSEQKPCADAKKSLPLARQEEGDREQVRENKERYVRLEILTGDRNHRQSLGERQPERSIQSPKEHKGDQAGGG